MKCLTATVLAASLLVPLPAHADSASLAALRASAHELELRTQAARDRIVRSRPDVRKESERIVAIVERKRNSVEARIEVLELADREDDAQSLREMEASLHHAERLIGLVEDWFGLR